MVKCGVHIPNFKAFGDPAAIVELAGAAERAGWDGLFLWDHIRWEHELWPVVDPWVALGAAAQATSTLRLGVMVTPMSRRRPWKLARETVTLDQLSNGRLIFGGGLGWDLDADFTAFGEEEDGRTRAEMLDEGLAVLEGLWSGAPLSFSGSHYRVDEVTFLPTPVQRPRIPVWLAGLWPNRRPFRRAARWDGVVALHRDGRRLRPDDVAEIRAFLDQESGEPGSRDIAIIGMSGSPGRPHAQLQDFERCGLTWWFESFAPQRDQSAEQTIAHVAVGPPR